MQKKYLLRQLILCCLLMLGTARITSAQILLFGITGPSPVCRGNTEIYYANTLMSFPGMISSFTWTITPASAGTVLSVTDNGGGYSTAHIQWHTAGTAVLSASSNMGDDYSRNIVVGALPEPIITSTVQLACQRLGDPKEDQEVPPRFGETTCQWVCENSPVTYTATGSTGSTYVWTVTGAASFSPAGSDCIVNWGSPGDGMVTVTETTTSGCKATKSYCVKITEGPTAKFRALYNDGDPIVICKGGEVILSDNSHGTPESPIVSWHWEFGDGQVSNQSPGAANNPIVHQYNDPGDYEITLTVTNSCGCTDVMTRRITVKDGRAPVITCPRVVCEGETVQYFVDQKCGWQNWAVEGGNIQSVTDNTVTVTWDNVDPATGFGYVIYKSCEECEMISAVPVPVVLQRAEIQGEVNICEGEEYVYRLPKWPTTEMNWHIISGSGVLMTTDQRNEIVLVPYGTGTVVLGCSYVNTLLGCGGETELSIQVNPKTNITGSQLVCANQSATYAVGGYTATWLLKDPAGNFVGAPVTATSYTPTFTQVGVYRLTASGSQFCPVGEYLITVKGLPKKPLAISGPDGACAGIPMKYTAGPLVAGTTFQWSVSSGSVNSAVGAESYITFAGVPNYTISVTRITNDAAQCASPALTKIVTGPVPALVISGEDTACHSTTQLYSLNYSQADAYEWTISPANVGSVINPNAGVWGGPGNMVSVLWNVPAGQGQMATLTVKVKKCNTYTTQSINVFVRGVPSFVAKLTSGAPDTTICSGTPVTLQLVPSYPVNSVGTVSWEWGNGSEVFNGPGLTTLYGHAYNTSGSNQVAYQPVVTIKDPNGCLGTVVTTGPKIYVKPAPVAFISPEGPIAQCDPVFNQPLTATITSGIGGSNTFSWTPAAPNSATINATALGLYSVVVSNSNGCSATSNIVQIKHGCPKEPCGPGPSPAIVLTGSNTCGQVNVHAAVSGPVIGFDWIYPSSATLSGAPTATDLNATFEQAGTYQFDYLAYYRNNAGDSCVVDSAIVVLVPYMAGLRYEIACNQTAGNYTVTLADRSSLYPGIPVTRTYYNSSWGNLGSGLSINTSVAGGTTNTYYMVIQDVSMLHPACTASVTVTLPQFPVADFDLATNAVGCVGNAFNFWNMSTGGTLSYLWNYGTAQSQGAEGGVVYSAPYINSPVSLTITDQYGCSSTKSQLITANANPYTGTISAMPNPACQGTAVNLTYIPTTGGYPITQYTWYRENTQVHADLPPNYSYGVTEPGGYWIKGTGVYGCEVKTATVPVVINQVPLAVISGNSRQCAAVPFTLTTDPVPGATYTWTTPGAILYTTIPSLQQTVYSPGTYNYTVAVTLNGCSRTSAPFTVMVNALPAPPIAYFDIACNPYQVTLMADAPTPGTFNWSNGGYGQSVVTYEGGPYQVTFTDLNGCKSTSDIEVPKDPAGYLWVFPNGCFCKLRLGKTYMIGPIIPFEEWAWFENGSPVASGGGVMPPYYPSPGNSYNMYLNNGYCQVMSEPMFYDNEDCRKMEEGIASDAPMVASAMKLNTQMLLVPNPAKETTTVLYSFTPGSRDRYIEVYDIIGRKLQTHNLTNERGELVLPMAEYSAGMYQVTMKENGKVVQQSKLSLTR